MMCKVKQKEKIGEQWIDEQLQRMKLGDTGFKVCGDDDRIVTELPACLNHTGSCHPDMKIHWQSHPLPTFLECTQQQHCHRTMAQNKGYSPACVLTSYGHSPTNLVISANSSSKDTDPFADFSCLHWCHQWVTCCGWWVLTVFKKRIFESFN